MKYHYFVILIMLVSSEYTYTLEVGEAGFDSDGKSVDMGIGCYVYENYNSDRKLVFYDGWMRLNNNNIFLEKESGRWPCCEAGSESVQRYKGEGVDVVFDLKQPLPCDGYQKCVSVSFKGEMTVKGMGEVRTSRIDVQCSD